mmetsp:Transcript_21330/g.52532  ORF Transcript_21330/g.52532 Transcript_21330/m.52532 type:complete len:217 (-) Transcript_21330:457-1107(-)
MLLFGSRVFAIDGIQPKFLGPSKQASPSGKGGDSLTNDFFLTLEKKAKVLISRLSLDVSSVNTSDLLEGLDVLVRVVFESTDNGHLISWCVIGKDFSSCFIRIQLFKSQFSAHLVSHFHQKVSQMQDRFIGLWLLFANAIFINLEKVPNLIQHFFKAVSTRKGIRINMRNGKLGIPTRCRRPIHVPSLIQESQDFLGGLPSAGFHSIHNFGISNTV